MAKSLQRLIRGTRKRRRRGRREERTHSLLDAGQRLLAQDDLDRVSITRVAAEAGCSVGAFYERFPSKDQFLCRVTAASFRTAGALAERGLPNSPRVGSLKEAVREVIEHVHGQLSSRRTAGATRAVVKLQATIPSAGKPLLEYRKTVTDRAVTLIEPHLEYRGAEKAIRIAMQMVLATIIDAAVNDPRPMKFGSRQLVNSLTELMISFLARDEFLDETHAEDREEIEEDSADKSKLDRKTKNPADEIEVYDADIGDLHGKMKVRAAKPRRGRNSAKQTNSAIPSKSRPQKKSGGQKPSGPQLSTNQVASRGKAAAHSADKAHSKPGRRRLKRI